MYKIHTSVSAVIETLTVLLNELVAFAACNSLALYTPEVCSLCPVQLDIGMSDDRILHSNNIIVIWMAHVANLKQILSV